MRHLITTNHEHYNFLFQQFHTSALELGILSVMGLMFGARRKTGQRPTDMHSISSCHKVKHI